MLEKLVAVLRPTAALPVALALLSLGACVSKPKNIQLSAPPESASAGQIGEMAEIVIVRPEPEAPFVTMDVWVNGDKLGGIRSREYVRTLVEPGAVDIQVSAESTCEASFPVESGRSYFLQAAPMRGWWYQRVQLAVMNPLVGRESVTHCKDRTTAPTRSR